MPVAMPARWLENRDTGYLPNNREESIKQLQYLLDGLGIETTREFD